MKKKTIYYKFLRVSIFIGLLMVIFQFGTFIHLSRSITQQNMEHASASVSQITEAIEKSFNEIRTAAYYLSIGSSIENYLIPSNDYELYKNHKYFIQTIDSLVKGNNYIQDVALYRSDGRIFFHYKDDDILHQVLRFHRMEYETRVQESAFQIIYDEDGRDSYIAYIQPVYYLTRINSFWRQQVGCLVVIVDKKQVGAILDREGEDSIGTICLVDQGGKIIDVLQKNKRPEEGNEKIPDMDMQNIRGTGWGIGYILNYEAIRNRYIEFRYMVFLMIFMAFLLLYALLQIYNTGIVRPISDLDGQIEHVISGGLKKRITMDRDDEIGHIAKAVNDMLDHQTEISYKMLYTQQQLYEKEIEAKENEFRILENQINPHFVLNTLQCICGIAVAYDVPVIADIAVDMSVIFHYSLRAPEFVTLNQELEMIRHYFHIIEVRFDGKYKGTIETPEEMLHMSVPKMLIQPLVENAVQHGMKGREEGHIEVRCLPTLYDEVEIVIHDDGCGIAPGRLEELHKVLNDEEELQRNSLKLKRIGIANSCLRIRNLYGTSYGVTIDSVYGKGTDVKIRLPRAKGEIGK